MNWIWSDISFFPVMGNLWLDATQADWLEGKSNSQDLCLVADDQKLDI